MELKDLKLSATPTASFSWFLQLRWGALVGQLALLLVGVFYYELTLPWREIALILAGIPLTDLFYRYLHQKGFNERKLIASLLLIDTGILTGVLYLSGGPTNPFSIVYLLHVVLAAVVLDKYWTWGLTAITSACFSGLFYFHQAVPEWNHGGEHAHHGGSDGLDLHLQGMLFAYLLLAVIVASFLTKMIEALKHHQQEALALAANQQRLASLTALATNTAHELGTPLSTITLVAHELELSLQGLQTISFEALAKDLALLKEESARCRSIIDELCSSSGTVTGESQLWISPERLIKSAYQNLSGANKIRLFIECGSLELKTSPRAVSTILRAIVKNALQACEECKCEEAVRIDAKYQGDNLILTVSDKAKGMPEDVLKKIGTPFISTKPSGEGMGLGIYVARLVTEQLGGVITFVSDGEGTKVMIKIPAESRSTARKVA